MATPDKSQPKLELDLEELDGNWSVPPAAAEPPAATSEHFPHPAAPDEATERNMPTSEVPGAANAAAGRGAASSPVDEMNDYVASCDWSLALVVAEQLLAEDGENAQAKAVATRCQKELETMYASRLGSLSQVVSVAVSMGEVTGLALDSRSAFILGLVDGISSIDMVLDMSGMPRLDALRVMLELVQQGVVNLA